MAKRKVSWPCPYIRDCGGTAKGVPDKDNEVMCDYCGSWVNASTGAAAS